ncbi:hypothetical protein [Promicromonospora xylanilytica]
MGDEYRNPYGNDDAALGRKFSDSRSCSNGIGMALTSDPEKARAMVRGFPMICLACWGVALAGIAVVLDERSVPAAYGVQPWYGAVLGIGLLFVGVLFDLLIIRFNRPKFLVPPHLRWEPGYGEIERARASADGATTPESAVEVLYEASAERWRERRG